MVDSAAIFFLLHCLVKDLRCVLFVFLNLHIAGRHVSSLDCSLVELMVVGWVKHRTALQETWVHNQKLLMILLILNGFHESTWT